MKIFVDDVREPPDPKGWVVFRDMSTALDFVKCALRLHIPIEQISLDHDMGMYGEKEAMNGDQFLQSLEEFFFNRYLVDRDNGNKSSVLLPTIVIHSANPEGVKAMQRSLKSMQRFFIT